MTQFPLRIYNIYKNNMYIQNLTYNVNLSVYIKEAYQILIQGVRKKTERSKTSC